MQELIIEPTQELASAQQQQTGEAIDLGMWLGRRQAFALMAGRCSAADAECIRDIRKQKRYRTLQMTWEQFCGERLGISRATADQIVRQLEEFGPEFFKLAQLTHVNPAEYRRLKLAVRGNALLHAGEEIPIDAENGPRLAAAIEELRQAARVEPAAVPAEQAPVTAERQKGPPPVTSVQQRLELADRNLRVAVAEFKHLRDTLEGSADRLRLRRMVSLGKVWFSCLRHDLRSQ